MCRKVWSGPDRAHCSGCHHTFDDVTLFDDHRDQGQCRSPRELGLIATRNVIAPAPKAVGKALPPGKIVTRLPQAVWDVTPFLRRGTAVRDRPDVPIGPVGRGSQAGAGREEVCRWVELLTGGGAGLTSRRRRTRKNSRPAWATDWPGILDPRSDSWTASMLGTRRTRVAARCRLCESPTDFPRPA